MASAPGLHPGDRFQEMWADSGVWRSSFGSVLISSHVILGNSLSFLVPQFSHLKNGIDNSTHWHINDTLVDQVL